MATNTSRPRLPPDTWLVLGIAIAAGVLTALLLSWWQEPEQPWTRKKPRSDTKLAADVDARTHHRLTAPPLEVMAAQETPARTIRTPAIPVLETFRDREFTILLTSAEEVERFRKTALAAGAEIRGIIPGLNAVGIRVPNDVDLWSFLADAGLETGAWEQDVVVRLPSSGTSATPTKVFPAGVPFGGAALDWLGGANRAESWGKGVKVAILDTGIEPHSALAGMTITRTDLVGDTGAAGDWAGHGTGVATLMAGHSLEVQGVAPGVELLSYRVLDASGTGDSFTVARGIVAAVDAGARIINLSLGTSENSSVLARAVQYAADHDVALVAACGNEGDSALMYPARYSSVIAVTAIDAAGNHVAFANSGAEVDLAAPGSGVNAGWTGDTVVALSGTSAAAPFVAGALAGLLSEDAAMTVTQAVAVLVNHADDQGYPGQDVYFGNGILDLERLRTRAVAGLADLAVTDYFVEQGVTADGLVPLLVGIQNRGNDEISGGVLELTVNGETTHHPLATLALNESGSVRFYVPRSQLEQQGSVSVQARVVIPGTRDARPGNNLLNTTIVQRAATP